MTAADIVINLVERFAQHRDDYHSGRYNKINSKYPYVVAWAAFVVLYVIAVTILNPVATLFFVATQSWSSEKISALVSFLLLLVAGFFVFRYVIKIFVLPYENRPWSNQNLRN